MSDATESYDLAELARVADVTPRTIRYYVQQGLLAPPGMRGPATRYDRGHLDRLLLIRQWQRLHLPLAEVRKRLAGMDDGAVRQALEAVPPDLSAQARTGRGREGGAPPSSNALDYVRSLLRGGRGTESEYLDAPLLARSDARAVPSSPASGDAMPLPSPAPDADAARRGALSPPGATLPVAPDEHDASGMQLVARAVPIRSTWERIALTADIELHIRRPLTRDDNRRVERLMDFARRLLGEEEGA